MRITAKYRWCLTGTPIHNSLDDYGTLLSFLAVTPFNDKSRFDCWIARPLKNGKRDSLARLRTLVRATCLRRTKKSLGDLCELPPRTEKVHEVEISQKDRELYEFFKERCSSLAAGGSQMAKTGPRRKDERKERNILSLINFLRLICDHGEQILPARALEAWIGRDGTAIDLSMIQACQVKCCTCDKYIEEGDAGASSGHGYSCQHSACFPCASRNGDTDAEQAQPCPKCRVSRTARVNSYSRNYSGATVQPSSKVEALLKNLQAEQADSSTSQGSTPTPVKRYARPSPERFSLPRSRLTSSQCHFQLLDQDAGPSTTGPAS
jgi:SNF2 family DNA or RNA helicase